MKQHTPMTTRYTQCFLHISVTPHVISKLLCYPNVASSGGVGTATKAHALRPMKRMQVLKPQLSDRPSQISSINFECDSKSDLSHYNGAFVLDEFIYKHEFLTLTSTIHLNNSRAHQI